MQLPLCYGTRLGWILLGVFAILLSGLPLIAQSGQAIPVNDGGLLSRRCAWVFGGGHVVLPLLKESRG